MIPPGPIAYRVYTHLLAYLNNEESLRPLLEAVYDAEDEYLHGTDLLLADLLGSILLAWAERTEYPGYEISEAQFRERLSDLIQTVWIGDVPALRTATSAETIQTALLIA